jgi:hypothetical protein
VRKLLVASLLLLPGQALAGPPEGVSGRMVEEVAEGLKRYRKETDEWERLTCLRKLVPTHDPRVAILLYQIRESPSESGAMQQAASMALALHFLKGTRFLHDGDYYFDEWWEANKGDLHRRASRLPR